MTPQQWELTWKLFRESSSISPEQRRQFVELRCGDRDVITKVLELYQASEDNQPASSGALR